MGVTLQVELELFNKQHLNHVASNLNIPLMNFLDHAVR